jgi:thymidine phosphorylase
VGIVLTAKVGDRVERGMPIGMVHARDEEHGHATAASVGAAYTVADEPGEVPPLVYAWNEEVR